MNEDAETSIVLALGCVVSALMFNGCNATQIRVYVETAIRNYEQTISRAQSQRG